MLCVSFFSLYSSFFVIFSSVSYFFFPEYVFLCALSWCSCGVLFFCFPFFFCASSCVVFEYAHVRMRVCVLSFVGNLQKVRSRVMLHATLLAGVLLTVSLPTLLPVALGRWFLLFVYICVRILLCFFWYLI